MKKLTGIAVSADGYYVSATMSESGGKWKLSGTSRWVINNRNRNALLMDKSVCLGIESRWVRSLPGEGSPYSTADGDYLSACTLPAHHQFHADLLDNNLFGIYPDDAFLCTLPLHLLEKSEDSFLSIFRDGKFYIIGLIRNRRLAAVFRLSDSSDLQPFIARIERYWTTFERGIPFPRTVYIFNEQTIYPGDQFSIQQIKTPSDDISIIRAAGLAFCHIGTPVPSFSGPSAGLRFRKIRKAAVLISCALFLFPLLTAAVLFFMNHNTSAQINKCKSEYNSIIANNTEIKDLLKSGETLAKKHLRLQSLATQPTQWGKLLHYLGSKRPVGLFFERFGSEPVPGQKNQFRAALTGWAESETIVTEMIKRLNSPHFITNVSLASLERDEKLKDYCRFKILCTLKF